MSFLKRIAGKIKLPVRKNEVAHPPVKTDVPPAKPGAEAATPQPKPVTAAQVKEKTKKKDG